MCLAVPGQVISIYDLSATPENASPTPDLSPWRTGRVRFGGVTKDVNLAYVPEVQVGDYVLVHVGFALTVIDPIAAKETLNDLLFVLDGPEVGK